MAVVNATFPTIRKSPKKQKGSKTKSTPPFDPAKNQKDLAKAKANVAMFYLIK